jgi:hypothetical protein
VQLIAPPKRSTRLLDAMGEVLGKKRVGREEEGRETEGGSQKLDSDGQVRFAVIFKNSSPTLT